MTTETYVVSGAGSSTKYTIDKTPVAQLDYPFDWSAWLTDVADSIASAVASIEGDDAALTIVETDVATPKVVVWLAGGTVGNVYRVICKITTANSPDRIEERSIYVKIKER